MSEEVARTPLKNRTAWSHLKTLRRATEIVRSWPEWKRDRVVFRQRPATDEVSNEAECLLQRKSA